VSSSRAFWDGLLVPNSLLITLVGVLADPSQSQQLARTHNKGEVSGRVELEYDLLLTQRLVAQPRFETNLAIQRSPELGIGRGINDVELVSSDCVTRSVANLRPTSACPGRADSAKPLISREPEATWCEPSASSWVRLAVANALLVAMPGATSAVTSLEPPLEHRLPYRKE